MLTRQIVGLLELLDSIGIDAPEDVDLMVIVINGPKSIDEHCTQHLYKMAANCSVCFAYM